jgi:large subunit ribosomal protein L10
VGHNLLLVSEEPKVKEMVRILKAVPFLPLLGEQVAVPEGGEMGWVPQSLVPSARNILSLMEPESTA